MSKLKGLGATARSLQHNFREIETPNADLDRISDNIHSATGVDEVMEKLRERLNSLERKPRKDAVTCVEYLMTASPEWFSSASGEQQDSFFKSSYEWLDEKYGTENIISFSIHKDETTPHIPAHIVPITKDGRLSAKELIGAKKQMQEDQTTFALKHEHIGLERGVKGSKAVHQDIKAYYASVNKAKEAERNSRERFYAAIPDKKIFESGEQYKKRVGQSLNDEFKSLHQKASHVSNKALTEERASPPKIENNELKEVNRMVKFKHADLEREYEALDEMYDSLSYTHEDYLRYFSEALGEDKMFSIIKEGQEKDIAKYNRMKEEKLKKEREEQRKADERKPKYRSQSRGRSI